MLLLNKIYLIQQGFHNYARYTICSNRFRVPYKIPYHDTCGKTCEFSVCLQSSKHQPWLASFCTTLGFTWKKLITIRFAYWFICKWEGRGKENTFGGSTIYHKRGERSSKCKDSARRFHEVRSLELYLRIVSQDTTFNSHSHVHH